MGYANLTPGQVAAAGAVFAVLGLVLCVARLFTKCTLYGRWGIDDWLVIPALIMVLGMGIATIIGASTHSIEYFTPPPDPTTGTFAYQEKVLLIILWSIDLMQVIALGCIKLSLMFFYRTIFNVRGGANLFNAISLATITLIAIWAVAFFFAFLFNCQGNPAANWTSYTLTLQYCWKESAFLLLYSYTDFITDLIVLVFPIPSIWQLQMPLKRKIAVIIVFIIGSLTIAASLVRAALFTEFIQSYNASYDINMLYTNGIYWIVIETGFALCTINLPILYNLRRHQTYQRLIQRLQSFTSLLSSRSRPSAQKSDGSIPLSWNKPGQKIESKESIIQRGYKQGRSDVSLGRTEDDGSAEDNEIRVSRTVDVETPYTHN